MGPRNKLLYSVISMLATAQAVYQGCFQESVRLRHFAISPGDYNPEMMTTLACMSSCGTFSYELAAITSGKFCYCASTAPPPSTLVADSFCDVPCVGDPRQFCGGSKYVSVFSATKQITGLSLTSDVVGTIILVGTTVTLGVSISTGNDVIYKFDYDDGSGVTGPNTTTMLTTTYYTPGEYTVLVHANDVNQTFQDQVAATTVRVDAPPGPINITCDPVFATYEEGQCSLAVLSGSSLSISVTVSTFSPTFSIEDPPLSLAGPPFNGKEALTGDGTSAIYLLQASEFSVVGKIIGWHMMVSSSLSGSSLIVLLLKPTCAGGAYCYSSNSCTSSCASATSTVRTCLAAEQFCAQAAMCQSPCVASSSRYPSSASSYQVVSVITLTVTATGYQYLEDTSEIMVMPGYILGLEQSGNQATLSRLPSATNEADRQLAHSAATERSTFSPTTSTSIAARHAIRAIASGESKVLLPFTFEIAGNFTLMAEASSTTLTASPSTQASTIVVVMEGVNASIVTGPAFGATGESVNFTVLPHTGNNVQYSWLFSDGTEFPGTLDQVRPHVFATKGVYSINVTTFNAVSSKTNLTEITIEDRIEGVAVSAEPTVLGVATNIILTLTSGSNYTCTWDFGDRTTPQETSEDSIPTPDTVVQHTFATVGSYDVSVTCSNDVSTSTDLVTVKVEEAITNLRMASEGAEKGQPFYLECLLDAGTDVILTGTFDGQALSDLVNISKYQWKSQLRAGRPPSSIPLTITAKNLVSNQTISLNFQILSVIVNPTLSTTTVNATSFEAVTFTVNAAAGSDVTVFLDYGDSVVDNYTQPSGNEWARPQTFNHTYLDGGRFTVTATFSNAAGKYTRSLQVLVLVGVGAIDCNLVDYALYYPPATVNMYFAAKAMPTEPVLTLNWGEYYSQTLNPPLQLNRPYPHTYSDTGVFLVTANLSNLLGSKTCLKKLTVVEKLSNASFQQDFPAAALNLPFAVTFCLFRGPSYDLCNITYNFDDGSPQQVFERQGIGKDGCDTTHVTYTDMTQKTVTVTATSPLETVSASLVVPIIYGIRESDLLVTTNGNVTLQSLTTFTLKYLGSDIPTNAQVKFEFGDGSSKDAGPVPLTINTSGGTQSLTHKYEKDGLFDTKVIIYNDATSVQLHVQVGVFQSFQNLKAEVFYLASTPPDQETFGLNGNYQLFPSNKPVYIRVSDTNNAFATSYETQIRNQAGDVVLTSSFSTSDFSVQLNQSGDFTIDVTARNPLYSASIPSKTITVIELVEGLSLVEVKAQVKMNEVKVISVSFIKVGTDTCLYVDYGDGVLGVFSDTASSCSRTNFAGATVTGLAGLRQIEHVYATEGYFTVRAVAENSQSSTSVTVAFSITGLDCSKPGVDIHNRRHYFTHPTIYKRSERIQVQGLPNIHCALSYANVKSWQIEQMDPSYDTVVSEISLAGLDTTLAELNIPPRFLNVSLYRIHFTMTMAGSYGSSKFDSSISTYIKVVESALIGVMIRGGASDIQRGTSQSLTLNPLEYSLDPDVDPKNPQGLTVTNWTCELFNDSSVGCDGAGFAPSSQIQTLNIGALQQETYRLTAFLKKQTRETRTEILVTVVTGSPPIVSIEPVPGSVYYQLSEGYKILRSSRFAMDCLCLSCSASDSPSYSWAVSPYDYRWPQGWRVLQPEDMKDRVIGQYSSQISIQPSLLELFNVTLMRVQCLVTLKGVSAKTSVNLQVNFPPRPGNCSVSPFNSTISTEDDWVLKVDGWTDEDGIEGYQYFILTDPSTVDKQITSVQTNKGHMEKSVCLSEGPDYDNYQQNIIVKVRDTIGASQTCDCGMVVVRSMSTREIRALTRAIKTNQLQEMRRIFAEGDQKTCTEKAANIMSLLNSDKYAGQKLASNFVNTMYGLEDKNRPAYREENATVMTPEVEYQMESERNDRAQVRSTVVSDMLQIVPQSCVAIQQVCSFLAQATLFGDEIDQACQQNVMTSLDNMTTFLMNPDNIINVPSEDIETALQNIVSVMGNIMDAAGNNGFFGLQSELEGARKDPDWKKYDTSLRELGSPDDYSSANTYEEAMKMHTARIHQQRQAETALLVRNKMTKTLDKLVGCFGRYSVPGQTLVLKSAKMKQTLEKTDVDSLTGKQLLAPDSVGGVVFPNTTFLYGLSSEDNVVVAVSQSTNYPLRYSDMALNISPMTHFISINMYMGKNNTKLSIQSLPEPLIVTIPKDVNAKDPIYVSMDPMIASWATLMNLVVLVNQSYSTIHVDIKVPANRQLMLVYAKGKLANIASDPTHDSCDGVSLIPKVITQNLVDVEVQYRYSLNSSVLADFTGLVSVGIRELNSSEFNMDLSNGCLSLPRYANGTDYFRGKFQVRVIVSQCLAISDSQEDWDSSGCVVSDETNSSCLVCYCNHMTTFAGGWVVVPNTIDWSYVFANADFLTNPTIYITVIVTAVLYIIFAIMARFKDKKLAEQLGVAPLSDNDPRDRYFYEVIVSTGMRRNAGTDSQVCFILSGEDDETDVRAFSDSKRKIFRRGQVDGFLMAVPRSLGYLNFMRIWHDNSGRGKFGSWYLNYIVIRDLQTDIKQLFIANRWFAVEEDDGQVDRVIPVANQEQMGDFSYQFGERSRKNFADGHLWFSVVARPPQSRFTCLQRVSCCLCLLYVTMLANAMFYNTTSEKESASNSFSFGPFSVAPEQVFIGVVSNLIVFPINFLLVYLFKKTRPHHKRPSRIDLAIKEVHDQNKQTNINDIKPEVSSVFSVSKTPHLPKNPHHVEASASRPESAMSNTSTEQLTPSKKKKKFELPWYFTLLAWVLLWVVTLGAVAMVIFYGISFKDETCKKWITSMLVSFFMSVFVTQPIKVVLFAVILSLIIKNPGEEKEDEEEDEELPQIDPDSELLHGGMSAVDMTRPRKIGYKPPDPQLLEKLREKRLKEIKMWAIIREVIVYSFFLWILMLISYRQMGASNFLYKNTLYKVFINNKQTDIDFYAIRNADEFWKWTTSGLVNGLRAGAYYNDYPPLKLRAYINDKVSRILGYATMRQLRIKPGQCGIPDPIQALIHECNVAYDMFDQEEDSYRVGWKPMQNGDTLNVTRQEYIYKSAKELNGYPYWGTLGWYSGGGYVVNLEGSKDELVGQMEQLNQESWIDRYTRAVFVEFTVYNPQVNLFAISTILAEFHPSGGVVASVRFEPAMLLPYMTSAMLFQVVCEIVYILFALFFIVRELRELFKAKLSYFTSFWNLVEIGIIAMSISAIVIFFYRLVVTNELTSEFKDSHGNGYIKFQYVAYWNEMFSYMIGFLCFLATIKFLKLLRFNRKMSMLSATLKFSAWSLIHFGIIFLIVFLAFSQLFYLTFMHIDVDYATFVSSMVAGVLMMMGKYDIYSMIMAEPVLTQIFVLLFVLTVTFILVNMFVTILNETFAAVREDINKQGNDYEVVNFMLQRFKQWTGLGSPEEVTSATSPPDDLNNCHGTKMDQNMTDHVQDFPDRIERLLKTISSVYMDNDNLAQLYQKKPYESQAGNKNLMRTGLSPSPAPGHNPKRKGSSDIVARVHTH